MHDPYFGLKSSRNGVAGPGFGELRQRLIRFVVQRIRNGEFTERGLARQIGVSQPQLHNVLKGVRVLKPELGDALLSHLGMTLLDLLWPRELSAATLVRAQPHAGWPPNDDRKPVCSEIQADARQRSSERKLAS